MAGIGILFGMHLVNLVHLMCKSISFDIFRIFNWFLCHKLFPTFLIFTVVFCRIKGTDFGIILQEEDQVEVSFTRNWDPSLEGRVVPLNIDKR